MEITNDANLLLLQAKEQIKKQKLQEKEENKIKKLQEKEEMKIKKTQEKEKKKEEEKKDKIKDKIDNIKIKEQIYKDDNNYFHFFGTAKEPFNQLKLYNMVKSEEITEAKIYVCTYFGKIVNPNQFIYHKYGINPEFIFLNKIDLSERFITENMKVTIIKGENTILFDLFKWFTVSLFDSFYIKSDIHKPLYFIDDIGYNCINLCKGFLHKEKKDYNEYSDEIKNNVQIMLDHILNVLCSKSKDQYEYILKWLSNVCKGNKNNSALYLKGPEGLGKSTFTDFLINYVIGNNLSLMLSDADVLTTPYNSCLLGKLLVVFEELPTFSPQQWSGASSKLKQMITGKDYNFSDKFEKKIVDQLLSNFIINSNVESLKNSDGRRYFILDLSTERIKDYEYFGNLNKCCNNKETGEAFFNYLLSIDTNDYNPQMMPETSNKNDVILLLLNTAYDFLKYQYLYKKKDINCKAIDLFNEYQEYCNLNSKVNHLRTATQFYQKLKEVGINLYQSAGYNRYKLSNNELNIIANKFKWTHIHDEYDREEPENKTNDVNEINDLQKLKDLLKEKEDEINKLKNVLTKYDPMYGYNVINKEVKNTNDIKQLKTSTKIVKKVVNKNLNNMDDILNEFV